MKPLVIGILVLFQSALNKSLGQEISLPYDTCHQIIETTVHEPDENYTTPNAGSTNLTNCDILRNCVSMLSSKMQTSFHVVKIERKETEIKIYPFVCGLNDRSDTEIGIISDDQFYIEKRGLFRTTWEIKYNFLMQIKHDSNHSFELITLPTVYEKRKKNPEWQLRSDINKDTNLPETIYKVYESLSHNIYQYLAQINTN